MEIHFESFEKGRKYSFLLFNSNERVTFEINRINLFRCYGEVIENINSFGQVNLEQKMIWISDRKYEFPSNISLYPFSINFQTPNQLTYGHFGYQIHRNIFIINENFEFINK